MEIMADPQPQDAIPRLTTHVLSIETKQCRRGRLGPFAL